MAVGIVVIPLGQSQQRALQAWVTADPSRIDSRLTLLAAGLAAAFAVPTVLVALYFYRLGSGIVRSGRFPAPGMRVVRDTLVLRGTPALRRGRALQFLAALLVLAAVGFVAFLWRLVSMLRVQ